MNLFHSAQPARWSAAAVAVILLTACGASTSSTAEGSSTSSNEPQSLSATPSTLTQPTGGTGELVEFASTDGELDVTLTAAEGQVPYAGTQRWAMTYNAAATGPTLRVRPGDRVTITLVNNLNEPTSLHTHGLHVSPDQDNPFIMVDPGQSYTYVYDIPADQQAGTYWYHPHVHELTAQQVAAGLSGAIVVEDDTDAQLAEVSTDRVLVVNDPPLTQANPWTDPSSSAGAQGNADMGDMSGHDMSGHDMGSMMDGTSGSGVDPMTAMMGRTGPRLLTNGQDGVLLAGSGGLLERAHVVNATASTRLLLTFTGDRMLRLSGTGGRLASAQEVTSIELAPGERTEVVLIPGVDGGQLQAQRLSNEGAGAPVGLPEIIATVQPDAGRDVGMLPVTMSADTRDLFAPDVQVAQQRVITLDGHMNPTIDGKPFDPDTVNFTARKGTVEEWVIKSNSPMLHPIHLHTWPFQVKGQEGWTDIVTVPANGEQVIRVAFDDFTGTSVIHCHVLDHEDLGMMAVIKVT